MDLHKVKDGCLPIHFMVMGPIENNVYIISDDAATIVVDPTCDSDVIIGALEKLGKKKLDAIILTHSHYDHVGAAAKLRRLTGATVIASKVDAPYIERTVKPSRDDNEFPACEVDQPVDDGDVVQIGNMAWKVVLTPGHTPGSMCLFLGPAVRRRQGWRAGSYLGRHAVLRRHRPHRLRGWQHARHESIS